MTRLERDSIGSATVRYDSPALGTITRRKLAYETLRPGEEGQALTERVAVEQDETTLTELACGFRSADGRSSTEAFFRGGMTVKTLQRLAVAWDRTLAAPLDSACGAWGRSARLASGGAGLALPAAAENAPRGR